MKTTGEAAGGATPTPPSRLPPLPYKVNDPEAFARNLAQLTEETGRVLAALVEPREKGETQILFAEEIAHAMKTLGHLAEHWLSDPKRALEAQTTLVRTYMDLWTATLRRLAGEPVEPVAEPDPRDKRFAAPEWSEHPLFDFLKQAYLVTTRWAERLADTAEGMAPEERQRAQFYVRQLAAALAPSNFVLTNPELLKETFDNNAENLVRGMRMLAEDIERGRGELRIRQSDPTKFGVGVNLATTPGKVVFQNHLMQLIQYAPATDTVLKRPLLIVPPWINKFYILDLTPEKSFIAWAVAQGHTVFTISWVNPDERLARKSFADYMREGPLTALDVIEKATGERAVNAIGYCVGGTLLGITLAYMAASGDDRIASATLLTTQVDFTHAGDLKVFVDEEQIRSVEAEMARRGFLEGRRMAAAFNMLRANDLIWPYVINNYLKGRQPFPFDLLYWNSDATRMPAANHSFYLRNCYLENRLSKGEMEIAGVRLDLSKVTIPIYNLATREDHIAPALSVFTGCRFFGGPVDYVLAGSGHIAGVVNPPAKQKYQFWTGDAPKGDFDAWLQRAEEHPGSWWPHWHAWIEDKDPTRVKARKPGGGKLKAIEDAPGSYVKAQA